MQRMQTLCTKHVVSDTARRLFNLGLGRLAHVVPRDVDPRLARTGVVMDHVNCITKELFVVDEKPTLSRMFTFRGCVDHCLAMHLHGLVRTRIRVKNINPRPENQKRIHLSACLARCCAARSWADWFIAKSTLGYARRTCA